MYWAEFITGTCDISKQSLGKADEIQLVDEI